MHGVIHDAIRQMVLRKYTDDAWRITIAKSGTDEYQDYLLFHRYPDELTFRIIDAAAEAVGLTQKEFLLAFGRFEYSHFVENGYSQVLRSIGRDIPTFLNNLDYVHHFLTNYIYDAMTSPSFRCEEKENGTLVLHYYSQRIGLYPMVQGQLEEAIMHLFHQEVRLELSKTCEFDVGVYKEYALFNIVPLDDGVPLSLSRRGSIIPERLVLLFERDDTLLDIDDFRKVFPFYVIFDETLVIRDAGNFFVRHAAEIFDNVDSDVKFADAFQLVHPEVELTWENVLQFRHMNFVVSFNPPIRKRAVSHHNASRSQQMSLRFSGQMIPVKNEKFLLYAMSPRAGSLAEIERRGMFLCDIPPHSSARDLILLAEQRCMETKISKALEETTSELQKLSKELEREKSKTDTLLNEILPRKISEDLKDGRNVPARQYESVPVLFSDIVSFTVIASRSQPMQIVTMLNELFTRFDKLTNLNNVYKVETIGDAYMVCAGVPEEPENAADSTATRIANMALGMRLACRQVSVPHENMPVQIRIGIHSGPVLAGVVGLKMPRYCLFGDTVNTASRMESHGVPGEIHISENFYKLVQGGSSGQFEIKRRGETLIKGKGKMVTYFLLKSLVRSNDDLLGPLSAGCCEIQGPSLDLFRRVPLVEEEERDLTRQMSLVSPSCKSVGCQANHSHHDATHAAFTVPKFKPSCSVM